MEYLNFMHKNMIEKIKNRLLDIKEKTNWRYGILLFVLFNLAILDNFTLGRFIGVNVAILLMIVIAYTNYNVLNIKQYLNVDTPDIDTSEKGEKPNLEIERKFLLKQIPSKYITDSPNVRTLKIYQYYLPNGERYRSSTDNSTEEKVTKYFLTTKKEISHGTYEENESEISEKLYKEKSSEKVRGISKIRYVIPYKDGMKWEIDEYTSCKMVTLEIELPSIDHPIEIPDWLQEVMIMEVTGIKEFSNFNLATKT